jgi:hypothetical protein
VGLLTFDLGAAAGAINPTSSNAYTILSPSPWPPENNNLELHGPFATYCFNLDTSPFPTTDGAIPLVAPRLGLEPAWHQTPLNLPLDLDFDLTLDLGLNHWAGDHPHRNPVAAITTSQAVLPHLQSLSYDHPAVTPSSRLTGRRGDGTAPQTYTSPDLDCQALPGLTHSPFTPASATLPNTPRTIERTPIAAPHPQNQVQKRALPPMSSLMFACPHCSRRFRRQRELG